MGVSIFIALESEQIRCLQYGANCLAHAKSVGPFRVITNAYMARSVMITAWEMTTVGCDSIERCRLANPTDQRELGELDRVGVPFSDSSMGSYFTSSWSLLTVKDFLKMFISAVFVYRN